MLWRIYFFIYVMDYFYKFDLNIIILKFLYFLYDRCVSSVYFKNYVFVKFCYFKYEKVQEVVIRYVYYFFFQLNFDGDQVNNICRVIYMNFQFMKLNGWCWIKLDKFLMQFLKYLIDFDDFWYCLVWWICEIIIL